MASQSKGGRYGRWIKTPLTSRLSPDASGPPTKLRGRRPKSCPHRLIELTNAPETAACGHLVIGRCVRSIRFCAACTRWARALFAVGMCPNVCGTVASDAASQCQPDRRVDPRYPHSVPLPRSDGVRARPLRNCQPMPGCPVAWPAGSVCMDEIPRPPPKWQNGTTAHCAARPNEAGQIGRQ